MADFISVCENERNESHEVNEAMWNTVIADPEVTSVLKEFANGEFSESEIVGLLITLIRAMKAHFSGPGFSRYIQSSAKEHYGLGGPLAYTDPSTGEADDLAAYLSFLDLVFFRASNGTPFAGVEAKVVDPNFNGEWYNVNSALAQILCALSGHKNLRVALFLCTTGFVSFWRNPVGEIDGLPAFDYFFYPPRTFDLKSLVRKCRTVGGTLEGLLDYARVVYEIGKTCTVSSEEIGPLPLSEAEIANKTSEENIECENSPAFNNSPQSPPKLSRHIATSQSGARHILVCFDMKPEPALTPRLRE